MTKSLLRWGRPAFGRPATIVLAIGLLAAAAFATWDYLEARRIKTDIERIMAKGEPVNAFELRNHERPEDSPAAPFYLAAAALAAGQQSNLPRSEVVFDSPESARTWLAAPDRVRMFDLLDRATALEFRGFSAGRRFSYRDADLLVLLGLARARTRALIETDDSEAAVGSLVSELRLVGDRTRPLAVDWFRSVWPTAENIERLLRKGGVNASHLEPVARLLATTLTDTMFVEAYQEQRVNVLARAARVLGPQYGGTEVPGAAGEGPDLFARLHRPFVARRLHRSLQEYERLIAAARQPWPQRIEAMHDAILAMSGFAPDDWEVLSLAGSRIAAVAVAAVRFKSDHEGRWPGTVHDLVPRYLDKAPVDPFSGEPIRLALGQTGQLRIYTVGGDRKDDGGPADGLVIPNRVMPATGDIGFVLQH